MSPPITSKKTLPTSRFIRKKIETIDWNPDAEKKEERGLMANMTKGHPATHNTLDLNAIHAAFGLDMSRAIPIPNKSTCFYNSVTGTSVSVKLSPNGTRITATKPIHSTNCGKDGKGKPTLFKNP